METLHIQSAEELGTVAHVALAKLHTSRTERNTAVLAISGDLGAGKTTFMQTLAKQLSVTENVVSPTFVLMKKYELETNEGSPFTTLVHMDVYRIEEIDEMKPLRFEELLQTENTLVCIEWAEKIKSLLPPNTVYMNITITNEDSREITFS